MSTTPLLAQHEYQSSYGSASTSLPAPVSTRQVKRPASKSSSVDVGTVHDGRRPWKHRLSKGHRTTRDLQPVASKPKELASSVFGQGGSAASPGLIHGAEPPPTSAEFQAVVASVKHAVVEGIQPVRIAKGSSGSYFARDENKVCVAVFKPKDEEPYGRLNPKTLKWIHRTFFSWVGFGRACLIPNLSYISEAAASHLDRRLGLSLVPRTELAAISSPAFFYDWIDRTAHVTKGIALPEKVGSFQLFARGFMDASQWLKEHPWPHGVAIEDSKAAKSSRHHLRRCLRFAAGFCGRSGADVLDDDDEATLAGDLERDVGRFRWTPELKDGFCDELQKLVALDYLMLNTDRGLDNFMISYASASPSPHKVIDRLPSAISSPTTSHPLRHSKVSFEERRPHITIAAIDNSLSFPWKHPDGLWRSYPYGWLWLPVSLIGRPFGEEIREHLIPLLSSPVWWEQTIAELRSLFELDPAFNMPMFAHQVAVMKGQGLNLLRSLKKPDEGPLELCRRQKLEVWTDELEVPDDDETERLVAETLGRDHPSRAPAVTHIHPAPASAAQEVLLATQQEAIDRPTSPPPTRPRPISASPEGTHWRSFQGVSGVSVMKLLDKESRRRGDKSGGVRPTSPQDYSDNEGAGDGDDHPRRSLSDGEEGSSTAQRGRGKRARSRSGGRRPTVFRGFSAGSVDGPEADEDEDGNEAVSTALLSQSIVSDTALGRPLSPVASRGTHRRWPSFLSAKSRASSQQVVNDEGERPQLTRIVLVERVKEVRGRRGWLRW